MTPNFPGKNRLCSVGLVIFLLLFLFSAPTVQADSAAINPAVLVKDINTATRSAEPQFLSAVGNRLLFAADDGVNGINLWATDVTGTGAFRLNAIKPLSTVVMSGGVGYFAASDAEHGAELWRTDGTTTGTQLVADLSPGTADGYPYALVDYNGSLFFFATTGNPGNSSVNLWKSDGTVAGTRLVTGRIANAGMRPYLLAPLKGKLFMVLSNEGVPFQFQLWVSDGTDGGTSLLKAFTDNGAARAMTQPQEPHPPGPIDPPYNPRLTEVNGTVFFYVNDGVHGIELWKSDGTAAGTLPATEMKPAAASSSPLWLTKFQDTLFFITADGLWKTQGTGSNAQLVKPGPFAQLVVAGNLLFSIGTDTEHGPELWRSDGTSAGTFLVKDIYPGSNASSISYLTALNGKVLFEADNGSRRIGLWQSDGTAAGTTLVKDISLVNLAHAPFTIAGGRLFFIADDQQHGIELWQSDGTASGTMLVDDINRQAEGSKPAYFTTLGEYVFFTAHNTRGEWYLWRSDGTSAGTQPIETIGPLRDASSIMAQIVNTDLYVAPNYPSELWRVDSSAGTATLLYKATSNESIRALSTLNNRVFFLVDSPDPQQVGLWSSDGTTAGTQRVQALQPGIEIVVINNTLYFPVYTAELGTEVWKSDGTAAGTMLLKDIYPGPSESRPMQLTNVNGALFFRAGDGIHGEELWKSDGTTDGTVLVKDIFPGQNSSIVESPTVVGNRLFFISQNSLPANYEVWVSDGTEAGTFMLKDIHPDNHPTTLQPRGLTAINSKLLFVANDVTTSGEEIWVSDGTTAGTQLLKDINPGPANGSLGALTNVNGVVLFGASDGSGQRSLWRSDGTAPGTQLLQAIAPQPDFVDWHQPAFVAAGNNIFFSADDGMNGQELWKIPLTPNQATLKAQPLVNVATDGVGQLQIDYGNQSSNFQRQVSLTAVLDAKLTYLSSSGPVTPTIQGNTLVWQLPDLAPLTSGVIDLRLQAPTAPLGTGYPVTLTLSTVTGDAAPVQSIVKVEVMMAAHSYLPVIKK